jgi:hypothetical protein
MYKWERPDEGNELGPEKVGKMESEERGWRESEGNRRAQRRTEEVVHGGIEGGVSRVDV